MPKITKIELLENNEQPILSIRTKTSVEHLPHLIADSFEKIATYLNELGECPNDVPFVAYHNLDMQNLDVEIGFPVTKILPDHEKIKSGSIPAGKSIFCMYRGSYSELEPIYAEMAEWIKVRGLQPTGTAYEYYYNDSEFPESELLTKIVIPIQ